MLISGERLLRAAQSLTLGLGHPPASDCSRMSERTKKQRETSVKQAFGFHGSFRVARTGIQPRIMSGARLEKPTNPANATCNSARRNVLRRARAPGRPC